MIGDIYVYKCIYDSFSYMHCRYTNILNTKYLYIKYLYI